MKPYGKTFRVSKVHKASKCALCSEDVSGGANHERKKAKADIEKELVVLYNEDKGTIEK